MTLLKNTMKKKINDVAIIRLEQCYPFPESHLIEILKPYGDVPLVWCQEEPRNMGAWNFLDRRIESVLKSINKKHTRPHYVGRKEAASPATGITGRHEKEQEEVIQNALFGAIQEQ
jgi:2-oxoglutarate dehydrogenase E1 component